MSKSSDITNFIIDEYNKNFSDFYRVYFLGLITLSMDDFYRKGMNQVLLFYSHGEYINLNFNINVLDKKIDIIDYKESLSLDKIYNTYEATEPLEMYIEQNEDHIQFLTKNNTPFLEFSTRLGISVFAPKQGIDNNLLIQKNAQRGLDMFNQALYYKKNNIER